MALGSTTKFVPTPNLGFDELRRDAIPEASVDDGFRRSEAGNDLAARGDVVELELHHLPQDPAATVTR